jgi:hypothetical protein
VNVGRECRGGGFVVVVVVGLFGDLNESEVDRVSRLCSKRVEVKVREEFSLCAKGDGVGVGASATPEDGLAIVVEVEVVVAPVDEWVDCGEPWFAKDKVVVGERVGECIQFVRVVVAADEESGCKGGDGRRTVGEDDGDGRATNAGKGVLFAKRRRDDVPLGTTID